MNEKSDLNTFFNGILNRFKMADGKAVGENGEIIEEKMAKDDRGAWINHLAEQYLKKEDIDVPPEDFEITNQDIIDEIAKREIDKIIGQ